MVPRVPSSWDLYPCVMSSWMWVGFHGSLLMKDVAKGMGCHFWDSIAKGCSLCLGCLLLLSVGSLILGIWAVMSRRSPVEKPTLQGTTCVKNHVRELESRAPSQTPGWDCSPSWELDGVFMKDSSPEARLSPDSDPWKLWDKKCKIHFKLLIFV